MDHETCLEPADIILTRGQSLLSRAIRVLTRSIGEPRTRVNHVGIVVRGGPLKEVIVVEALSRVRRHKLSEHYAGTGDDVAVYRSTDLSDEQRQLIVSAAEGYVGREYGYFKALLHVLDWIFLGVYLFRRLGWMDRYPICSWLVAHSFKKAGLSFGVTAGQATPDDIWDFVNSKKKLFWRIRGLWPIDEREASVAESLDERILAA